MRYVIKHSSGFYYVHKKEMRNLVEGFSGITAYGATKFDSKNDAQIVIDILVNTDTFSKYLLAVEDFDNDY